MNGTLTAPAARLLGEAAEWRLISVLLERPTPARLETLAELARDTADEELRSIAATATEASEGPYLLAFGPGGIVSPREIAHSRTRDPGHVLAQLGAVYDAFAYRPHTEETPDHVSVETGFMAYLCLKEAFAAACGDEEAARLTSEAAAAFLERHLSTFAQPLAERLAGGPDVYLSRAAQALLRRTGPRRADAEGGWTPDGLDEACLTCPGCEPAEEDPAVM